MNMASPFIDASQLYGHSPEKAATLRTHVGGKLATDIISGQEFCPQLRRNGSLLCGERDNVGVCFDAGDPRVNQHWGITVYHTIFVRFHNFVADMFQVLNPGWTDEILYQEVRKFVGAINQIIFYRDFLPILLGKEFTKLAGLSISKYQRTEYNPNLIPQMSIEFSASAFRILHNITPSKYNFMDSNRKISNSENLNEWMSISDPLVGRSNFDDLLRGMTYTPGRAPTSSYNTLISNFMNQNFVTSTQDLLSIDIQRGRDTGVPTYNSVRELCGFKRAVVFEDFEDNIPISDIMKLKQLYATVDDVDLLVGALLESPCYDAMVGPTARCILADVFYRIRFGDRFFFDVEGQPGSFSQKQLEALWDFDLGHIFCASSDIIELPSEIFEATSREFSPDQSCPWRMFNLNLIAWKDYRP